MSEQIVMAIPAFGKSFKLSTSSASLGSPVDGPAPAGPMTGVSGVYSYYEVISSPCLWY